MLHLQNRNTLIVSDHHEMRELWQRQQSPWSRCQLSCTGYRLNTVGWILGENKCSTASNKKIAECDKETLSRKRCCRKKAKIRNDVIFKKWRQVLSERKRQSIHNEDTPSIDQFFNFWEETLVSGVSSCLVLNHNWNQPIN